MRNKIDFINLGHKMLAVTAFLLPFSSFAPLHAFASVSDLQVPDCNSLKGASCGATGPTDLIVKIVNILLGVSFAVAVLFLVIGGFRYIISSGNEEQAAAGRKTIINALIGIAVVILSYVIVAVVVKGVSGTSQ